MLGKQCKLMSNKRKIIKNKKVTANIKEVHFFFFVDCLCVCFVQDIVNVLVRHSGPAFFSIALPGSSMLVLDFIEAANTIVTSSDLKGVS